jgi:hypothetical protein
LTRAGIAIFDRTGESLETVRIATLMGQSGRVVMLANRARGPRRIGRSPGARAAAAPAAVPLGLGVSMTCEDVDDDFAVVRFLYAPVPVPQTRSARVRKTTMKPARTS